ncbi:MAG: zinc-binding alcohol dehydrogenase, partial [Aggregatilineales bacterium]
IEAETTVISAGTELAIYSALAPGVRNPDSWNAYPYRPGYGLVGRVMATGEAVDRVTVGDRVFCFGQHASHQVYNMASGKAVRSILKVDEDLPAEQLVMLRMAMVAIHAPQITDCHPGDTVAIFGLGIVGNLAAQLYRQAGLHVIGVDPVKSRCELARQVGIETVVDVAPERQLEAIRNLTNGRGAQVTVEAVGHSAIVNTSIAACADSGQVILLGSPRAAYEADMTPAFRDIHLRWLTVRGALEWRLPPYDAPGIPHSVESNLRRLIDALRCGDLNVSAVTSHIIKPFELPQAYDGLLNHKDAYLGTVIDWRK